MPETYDHARPIADVTLDNAFSPSWLPRSVRRSEQLGKPAKSLQRLQASLFEHGHFIARRQRSLVKQCADLAVELPDAPAATERLGMVELPGFPFLDLQQPDVVRPRERKRLNETAVATGDSSDGV